MIHVYEPYITPDNLKYAKDALDSTWISSHGKYINMVKDDLLLLHESHMPYVILCNNGTSATHLMAIGIKYRYPLIENIIVPNNVYVAAWNAFQMNPIYNLIPIDANADTWNIDYSKLDEMLLQYDSRTTAVLVVHNMGTPVDVPSLTRKYPDYVFVEDNCEGFLGRYGHTEYPTHGVPTGTQSFMSSVSFFGNKNITSGEGGAVFIRDGSTFEYLNSTRSQGITHEKFIFDKLGYNYRMTNVQAAILYGQLKDLSEIVDRKRYIFNQYYQELCKFGTVPYITQGSSRWMFGISGDFDSTNVARIMYQNGIETRPMFPPMSYHKHLTKYADESGETNAKYIYDHSIILPSHPNLTKHDVHYIIDKLKYAIDNSITY